ncbi:hypothetical protein JCGZ_15324 [Jatropha curcas]|uniref:SBP-type domain-containing protein n=1 Tax=Jatropha curcas TaxID=180498 RepID=A0A067LM63_JATCU|nr:squamosa promoter-binding protein 1 [Jatropha curcas]KDP45880.1 hypothetical protein JCGZ_15324 [Jatropha curcas]
MDTKTTEGKWGSRIVKEDRNNIVEGHSNMEDYDMEEEEGNGGFADDEKKKGVGVVYGKRGTAAAGGGGGGGVSPPSCQVEKCGADLSDAKRYHRRHKVCEVHAKAPAVIVAGLRQRFCQQCSRFHELSEFDEAKRSCRRRLAGHNERRRKSLSAESNGESSSLSSSSRSKGAFGAQLKETQCLRQVEERPKYQITIPLPGNSDYKRSQLRS